MSAGGFHVNGAREHKLERAAQCGHDDHSNNGEKNKSMVAQIAVIIAIIATVGALFAYMGGATQANAGLSKKNATIKKT